MWDRFKNFLIRRLIDVGSDIDYGKYDNSKEVSKWISMYEGKPSWCNKYLRESELSAAIVSELARRTTIEMESWIEGGEKGEQLNEVYSRLVEQSRFTIEEMLVKGAVILKPFIDVDSGRMGIDVVGADSFIPLKFNKFNELEDVVFLDVERKGQYIYTRYETHYKEDGKYVVKNEIYLGLPSSSGKRGQKVLDWKKAVPEWSDLSEINDFGGRVTEPLFVYMKAPFANKADLGSPLGSSVLAKVEGLIEDHDELYGRMMREYHATRTVRYVPRSHIQDIDGEVAEFKDDDTYVMIGDPQSDKKIEVISPEIKNANYMEGMEALLRRIEFNCGLAYGDLSKNDQNLKTATEVLASKERGYNTIEDIQKRVEYAYRDLVAVMSLMYDLRNNNYSRSDKVEVKFHFDDGVITQDDLELRESSYEVN